VRDDAGDAEARVAEPDAVARLRLERSVEAFVHPYRTRLRNPARNAVGTEQPVRDAKLAAQRISGLHHLYI